MRSKFLAFILLTTIATPCFAVTLDCTGAYLGEFFIDTETGTLSYAGETQRVKVNTDNAHYGFEGHAWGPSQGTTLRFTVGISRSTGVVTVDGDWFPSGDMAGTKTGICKQDAPPKF